MNKEPINIPHVPEDACLCRACVPREEAIYPPVADEHGAFDKYPDYVPIDETFFAPNKVYGTTVDVKRENFQKFADLISNQFNHGGDKYKLQGFNDREATDVISSVFGGPSEFDWVLGTMMKYLFRFKNFHREKDLLKIATYCYILWLKQGNHLKTSADEDVSK